MNYKPNTVMHDHVHIYMWRGGALFCNLSTIDGDAMPMGGAGSMAGNETGKQLCTDS